MPIKIPDALPATAQLEAENIFVMTEYRALRQDIRPLRIVILNLMPVKIVTETQLLRLLSNSPLQVEVDFMQMATHVSKNTPAEHLIHFYQTFDELKDNKYDGMIITGAPVEQLPFEQVDYWDELCRVMEWTEKNVFSTLHICWGAQAGLYYHYGINKTALKEKMFGVFEHRNLAPTHKLMQGFDDVFFVPHSRHTGIDEKALAEQDDLLLLSKSDIAGPYIIASRSGRMFFVTGHSEYDRDTLANEYHRDISKGLPIRLPVRYFPGDDPSGTPLVCWRSHANLLFVNWLNYFVYQATPYNISGIGEVNPG